MGKSKKNTTNNYQGFTIVELLIVIVIIGILAAITIISYTGISKKAGESTVQAELANAKKQIALYYVDHGAYPTSLEGGTNCLKGTVAPSPDTKYCLKSSAGSTFSLTDATGSDYTLTLTKGTTIAYKVTKDTGPTLTTAVAAAASFVKTWGGTSGDFGKKIIKTSDDGYAVVGMTDSFGVARDMFLAKYDASGILLWNKTWGGTGNDTPYQLVQTSDGGYAVTGTTGSFGVVDDMFLVKYDSSGNVLWNKLWGGADTEIGQGLVQTSDGGYAITGLAYSYGAGTGDMFLAKYDSSGSLSWNKTWGGSALEYGTGIIQTDDGGYIITGPTQSYGAGSTEAFIVKYDSSGNVSWNKTWGGINGDSSEDIIKTNDGGFLISGGTSSFGAGGTDIFLVKYNSSGALTWNKTWGGASTDYTYKTIALNDNNYIISGYTNGFGAGSFDTLLVKVDNAGALIWNKTWGSTGDERVTGATIASDGGYVLSGYSNGYSASYDMTLVKFDSGGVINNCISPMCQTPTATVATPSATITTPTATVSTPSATITTPTAAVTTPSATVTTIVAP